jgi:hypothetical protein
MENAMNLAHDIATLPTLSVAQLRSRYAEIFGETTHAGHKGWLVKRIAWRMQALAEGDLSERARVRAADLANDADLRLSPPKPRITPILTGAAAVDGPAAPLGLPDRAMRASDPRLPGPGAVLRRLYKGQPLEITVLHSGFAYGGQVFASLSAVAKAITGSHCNGYLFFRRALCKPRGCNAHHQGPRGELMDDRHSEGGAAM